MRYYIISGEASGDLHGSNFIKAIKQIDSSAQIRAWGGDRMKAAGATLVHHYSETAFMGVWEVVKNIRRINSLLNECKKDILEYKPDVVVLIDYPGFNLRMAKFAKENNFKTCWYISPKLWAWKENRAHDIKKYVGLMLCIFPFEVDFYHRWNYEVKFVGHPLLDALDDSNFSTERNSIALLPGSREQEIKSMAKVYNSVAQNFPGEKFLVAALSVHNRKIYSGFNSKNIQLVFDDTHALLRRARAALVNSGTATLETALLDVPQMVCYKTSALTYMIAKQLVKVKWISPVNLVLEKEAVREFIQQDCSLNNLSNELEKILRDENYRKEMLQNYSEMKTLLGGKGASENAAKELIDFLK